MRLAVFLVWVAMIVSDKGGRFGFVYRNRWNTYRALRRKGHSKKSAARISNAGRSFGGRSAMARQGARRRRR